MENYDECTASDAISKYIALYGQATLQTKIAHVIDGLKCVSRRILWTIGTSEKPRKVTSVTGATLEKYHPSGDQAVNDAIARLAQPYNNIVPLIDSETNVGMYGGGSASAARYLEVFSAAFTRDVFFNGIDAGVYKYIPTEYGEGEEPAYLIPKIPMALLTGDFGMAIGHKTEMAMMEFDAVCNLVKRYIELRKRYGNDGIPNSVLFKETAELLIPDFPVFGLLRNRSQLLKEYSQGNYDATVITDGILEIHQNSIRISSLPWGVSPPKVEKELGGYMVAKLNSSTPKSILPKVQFMHQYFSEVAEHSTGDIEASLEFTMRRGVSPFEALEHLKHLAKFSGRFNPKTLMIDLNGKCSYMSPTDVLEVWYNERVKSILNELKIYQNRYLRKVRELEAQIVIIDHTKEVTDITQSSDDDIEASFKLARRFKLTEAQAQFIMSVSMRDLTRKGKDALVNEKDKTHDRLQEMQRKFKSIDDTIYEEVEALQKKYAKKCPRKCKFPDFIGAVKINDNGYVQVRSIEEIDSFMVRFDNKDIDIILYPSGPKNKFIIKRDTVLTEDTVDHPREFVADELVVTRFKPKYTIYMLEDSVSRVQGVHAPTKGSRTAYVGDSLLQISNSGEVTKSNATELTLRKSIGSRGSKQDVMFYSDLVAPEVVVVYCNTREKNRVRISRVTVDKGKILKLPIGKTQILGIYRVDSEFAISVPNKYLSRCNIRHLIVKGSDFPLDVNVEVDLNKRVLDDGRKITKMHKRSHIYRIK